MFEAADLAEQLTEMISFWFLKNYSVVPGEETDETIEEDMVLLELAYIKKEISFCSGFLGVSAPNLEAVTDISVVQNVLKTYYKPVHLEFLFKTACTGGSCNPVLSIRKDFLQTARNINQQ